MDHKWSPSLRATLDEVKSLMSDADDAIRMGQPARAVWRLVDAAGIIGRAFGGEGYDSATGRGFKIEDKEPS